MYDKLNKESGKNQFLTYYLIAAHPGCEEKDMHELKRFTTDELKMNPRSRSAKLRSFKFKMPKGEK